MTKEDRTYIDFRGKRVSARNMFIRGWINIIIIIMLGLVFLGLPIGMMVSLFIDMNLGIIVGIIITLVPVILVVLRFVKKHGWRRGIEELGITLHWGSDMDR